MALGRCSGLARKSALIDVKMSCDPPHAFGPRRDVAATSRLMSDDLRDVLTRSDLVGAVTEMILDQIRCAGLKHRQDCILRLPEVMRRTGLKRSSLYVKISAGTFPEPIRMSPNMVGWLESEVQRWIDDLRCAGR